MSLIAVESSEHGGLVQVVPTKQGRARLVYTPPAGFTGTDTIRFSSIDESGNRVITEVEIVVSDE